MADTVQEGDKVSWNWGGSHPSGTAAEVKAGEVTVTSHRGNDITKTGTEEDPAVHIERSGNDVVKTASELKVEEQGGIQKEEGTSDNSNGSSSATDSKKDDNDTQNGTSSATEAKKDDKENQNGTSTNGNTEEAHAGDKRKADVQSDTKENEKPSAESGEKEAKKQKTINGTTAPNGKKGPGRPKGTGVKKEKKERRVGTAARKTRSQSKTE